MGLDMCNSTSLHRIRVPTTPVLQPRDVSHVEDSPVALEGQDDGFLNLAQQKNHFVANQQLLPADVLTG